ETAPAGTTTSTYAGNQQTTSTRGGATARFWYDTLGNLSCQTTSAGSAADCAPGAGTANLLVANEWDYLDRLKTAKTYSAGAVTDSSAYTYDALDRLSQETETHTTGPVSSRTTDFSYQGQSDLVSAETQTKTGTDAGTETKTYAYDAYGHRIGMSDTKTPTGGTATPVKQFTYSYDPHGSTSLLVDEATGQAQASYGYTPYGNPDTALSKNDTDQNSPLNPYRYTAKRFDSGSKTIDMGARRFSPDTGRFNSIDMYQGALDDLGLAADPLGQNRYALAAGNPLSFVETDGHMVAPDGGSPFIGPVPPAQPTRSTARASRPAKHHNAGYNGFAGAGMGLAHLADAAQLASPVGLAATLLGARKPSDLLKDKQEEWGVDRSSGWYKAGDWGVQAAPAAVGGVAAAARGLSLLAGRGAAAAAEATGLGDLTAAEVRSIQATVNEAGRPLDVVGSAARGERRGVGSGLPIGKGPGTRSDIDYLVPHGSVPYYESTGLHKNLPDLDQIIAGVHNPFIGPSVRFEPFANPFFVGPK
ncbi:MAG: hypothetical protein LC789_14445, partial [Actinobacteria bacterium]|nr:hypothetical protein [Actinomycetota bacterium]MCA1720164.1 hypothetical protein [Actinomycetota bacterium]